MLRDLVHLRFEAADRWFVEDDPVYAHFRDPYHRIDVLSASRHVVVRHRVEDAAWSLPHPLPEGAPALEHLSFYPDKVEVTIDDRPVTA